MVVVILFAMFFGWTWQALAEDPVTVGSKEFTEQLVLG